MSGLYPEVRDTSTITGVFNQPMFLAIGVEGFGASPGTAVVGTVYTCKAPTDADTYFGATSSLATLVKFLLARGAEFVYAVASSMTSAPVLAARQSAWTALEENPVVRVRLTDSTTQADLVALADSCEWAEGIQNKQFCIVGMPSGTTKASLISAAGAIGSKRAVLVGPAIYDGNGNLLSGAYSAAAWAVERAKNLDLSDDMDLVEMAGLTGIEKSTNGMPVFRLRAGAGTPVNDFTDLLAGGVSPLQQSLGGSAAMTHARTTYVTDTTFDALNTLLVKDQLFIDIRQLLLDEGFLRRPNIPYWQGLAAKRVDDYLSSRAVGADAWITDVQLPNGTRGFGVTVEQSSDKKKMTIHYQAEIDRGTQTIDVNGVLTIAV